MGFNQNKSRFFIKLGRNGDYVKFYPYLCREVFIITLYFSFRMIYFFRTPAQSVIATSVDHALTADEKSELCWLYGEAKEEQSETVDGYFVGPRREMITPWSTNAVEITQNMAIKGVQRIEEYFPVASEDAEFDPMLQRMYKGLDQNIFTVNIQPAPILHIENLEEYNEQEGLALSPEEIEYLTRWKVSWAEN